MERDYRKDYEEALKRAKEDYDSVNTSNYERRKLETIFPELLKSEDERIRKELIDYFTGWDVFRGFKAEQILAWLEKQGEQMSDPRYKYLKELLTADDIYQMSMNDAMVQEAKTKAIDALSKLEISNLLEIEKQSEQKSADKVESKFKAGDFITDGERIFKIKETIWERNNRNDGSTYCESLIVNLRDGITYADDTDLKEYHLWTIQDAKDGDVLALNGEVFIYAHRKQLYNIAVAHCFVDCSGVFHFDGEFGYTENGNSIHPATKEQRDTLMKAMTDAEYTFDFEKKELKKNEKNPVWSEDDERIRKLITNGLKLHGEEIFTEGELYKIFPWLEKQGEQYIKWNKNTEGNKPQKNHSVLIKTTHGIAEGEWNGGKHWIQYRWSGSIKDSDVLFWIELSDIEKQGEQKPAWSKEDEKIKEAIVKRILENYNGCSYINGISEDVVIDWLKSLKERMKGE